MTESQFFDRIREAKPGTRYDLADELLKSHPEVNREIVDEYLDDFILRLPGEAIPVRA